MIFIDFCLVSLGYMVSIINVFLLDARYFSIYRPSDTSVWFD